MVRAQREEADYWRSSFEGQYEKAQALRDKVAELTQMGDMWKENYIKLEEQLSAVELLLSESQRTESYRAKVVLHVINVMNQLVQSQGAYDEELILECLKSIAQNVDGLEGKALASVRDHSLATPRYYMVDVSEVTGDHHVKRSRALSAARAQYERDTGARSHELWSHIVDGISNLTAKDVTNDTA